MTIRTPIDKRDIALQMVLLTIFGLLYGYWACNMSTLIAPDELMRYLVPKYIAIHGCLPIGSDPEVLSAVWGRSYAFEVYGSSLLASIPMAITSLFTTDESLWLIAARLTNVALSVLTLFFCLKIGKRLFKTKSLKYLFTIMIGLWPQYVFLSSYFNSDIIGLCATTCTILALIKGIQEQWQWKNCILLGLAVGYCTLSYYYAYGIIVVAIIVFFASQYSIRKERRQSGNNPCESATFSYLLKPLTVFAVAVALAGWFFIRNIIIYGDLFGMSASDACAELYAKPEFKPSLRPTPYQVGYSFVDMLTIKYSNTFWVLRSVQTFTGVFGAYQFDIPHALMYTYIIIVCAGTIGGVVHILRNKSGLYRYRALFLVATLLTIAIPIGLSFYYSWFCDWQPQGRYFINAIFPLAMLCTYGFGFAHQNKGLAVYQCVSFKERVACLLPFVIIAVWAVFFIVVFTTTIEPYCLSDVIIPR